MLGKGWDMVRRLLLALTVAVALLAPSVARAQSSAELIAAELDAWWAQQFADRGIAYSSPRLELVTGPGMEFCGQIDVYYSIAGYCSTNRTITISEAFVSPDTVDLLITVLSHEWGHHIQNLTDTGITTTLESELQADCFGGAFIEHATDAGLISPAIGAIALQLTQSAGDVWWAIPYDEAVHGNDSERAEAFMAGLHGGLAACGF